MTGGMMFKGTPGPWHYIGVTGGASTVPVPVSFVLGPKQVVAGDGVSVGYSPEDARLIAAAPELLEALIKILPYAEEHCDEGPWNAQWKSSEFMEIINASEAAIAKALGEQK